MQAIRDGIFLTAEEAKDLSNMLWQAGMQAAQKADDGRRTNIEKHRTACLRYLNWSGKLVETKKQPPKSEGIFLTLEEIKDLGEVLVVDAMQGAFTGDWYTKINQAMKQPIALRAV